MRLIDADRLLDRCKFYHLPNGDIAVPIIDVQHAPAIVPEQSRIEKELHGLTPKQQYNFLDNLMHKKSVGWNSTALYVIAWLNGEED